ncbi:MAG: lytic murein transglycosylase [Paracoccaceae bacterium]|jgi:lytic murein transglycosylase
MRLILVLLLLGGQVLPLKAASCGGDFALFVKSLKSETRALGVPAPTVDAFFKGAALDPRVIRMDRNQGHFQKDFLSFSAGLISSGRLKNATIFANAHATVFAQAQDNYGIPQEILLAFLAFETDFGVVQGEFNVRNALITLAHDCRRPEVFRPQILAAIALAQLGMFYPQTSKGAWAGEMGMVQMLPADILEYGVDGDRDGLVSLTNSVEDAILTAARLLQSFGWKAGGPWLQEVTLPASFDWSVTGLKSIKSVKKWKKMGLRATHGELLGQKNDQAVVILPQGRFGPAFLAHDNFQTLFNWNQSFVYVTTVAYFGTLLDKAPKLGVFHPEPMLSESQMNILQQKLSKRGYDVGKIDGILGAGTRSAVRAEQTRLGLPADGWPNQTLLNAL